MEIFNAQLPIINDRLSSNAQCSIINFQLRGKATGFLFKLGAGLLTLTDK